MKAKKRRMNKYANMFKINKTGLSKLKKLVKRYLLRKDYEKAKQALDPQNLSTFSLFTS